MLAAILSAAALSGAAPALAQTGCLVRDSHTGVRTSDLGSAIAAADPGDTLNITGTCTGNFTVTIPLTLKGGLYATLDGGGSGTVLTIDVPTGTVNVEFLKIMHGSATEGAGISADAGTSDPLTLDLAYDRLLDDTASFAGGGLDAGSITALNITDSAFTNDTIAGGADGAEGAAIASGGEIDIVDSNIIGNGATAPSTGSVLGGALYLTGPAILNTEYVNQTTVSAGRVVGGGVDATSSLSVVNSQIADNTATTGAGSISGAGLYAAGSSLQIETTNVGDNIATTGGGTIAGAGIDAGPATPVELVHSSVSGNTATSATGPVTGVGIGGGGGSLTLEDTGVFDNHGSSTAGDVDGGAIDPGAALTISGGLLTANAVTSSQGLADGGALFTNVPATVSGADVTGNSASSAGGGAYIDGPAGSLALAGSLVIGNTAPIGSAIDNDGGSESETDTLVVGSCVGCSAAQRGAARAAARKPPPAG